MSDVRERFISVDVETAGPIPGEYSLLSIGACDAFRPEQSFECYIRPINKNADPKALAVAKLSLDYLSEEGLEPSEAMGQFSEWLSSVVECGETVVFVGFNAPFDWSFVNYYLHRYLGENPFGFTALDIKALYMGKTGCSWADTKSSRIAEHLSPGTCGDHTALKDAQYQAELFRLVLQLRV